MVAQRKRRHRWIKRTNTHRPAMWAQNLSERQYHKTRYIYVYTQQKIAFCNFTMCLSTWIVQMWKKTQKHSETKAEKSHLTNNYSSIMAVCKCFDGFMYSNDVFSLFVCLCNFLRVFFSVRLPLFLLPPSLLLLLVVCRQYVCMPSQRNHEIDTLKHIGSSDEPERAQMMIKWIRRECDALRCYVMLFCECVLGQVKLTLIVYA